MHCQLVVLYRSNFGRYDATYTTAHDGMGEAGPCAHDPGEHLLIFRSAPPGIYIPYNNFRKRTYSYLGATAIIQYGGADMDK